jgi:septation ring formation regulator EzrA
MTPPVGGSVSGPASKFRLSRSGPNLERLEEEYRKVVDLIDAIGGHLASQAQHSDRMARSLDRLAASLANVPETSQKQSELLTTIRDEVSADAACTKRVEECISQLPHIADAQRETMVSIGRQLDLSRDTSERVAATMGEFQQTIGKVGEATSASTKALQEMRWDASARDERITDLLAVQSKRFALFAWSAIALAAVAAAVGLVALFR